MFDINDDYFGGILAHPDYFRNPKSRSRIIQAKEADPFFFLTLEQALTIEVVTLLRKNRASYYDEDYSRYPNELWYELYQTNSFGIALAYVKPFVDCYDEELTFYIQEDIIKKSEF